MKNFVTHSVMLAALTLGTVSAIPDVQANDAADAFKKLGQDTKDFGKKIGDSSKKLGKDISESAKKTHEKTKKQTKAAGEATKSWWQGWFD